MTISIIVAVAKNGIIGAKDNPIPWDQPDDRARFHKLTLHHSVVMGRKTYETIGHPLSSRQNIIVTHNHNYCPPDVEVAFSLPEALKLAKSSEIFIIGGGDLYKQAIPLATKLYLTSIDAMPKGNVSFNYDPKEWIVVYFKSYEADSENQFPYSFINLIRKTNDRINL